MRLLPFAVPHAFRCSRPGAPQDPAGESPGVVEEEGPVEDLDNEIEIETTRETRNKTTRWVTRGNKPAVTMQAMLYDCTHAK